MNILYLCDEYPPGRHGGIGSAVQLLAQGVSRAGHTVIVAGLYDWGYGGEDQFNDGKVKVFRFRRTFDHPLFRPKEKLYVRGLYRLFRLTGIFQLAIDKSLKRYQKFLEGLIHEFSIDVIEMPDFLDYIQYCYRYTPFPSLSKPVIVKLHGSHTFFRAEAREPVPAFIRKTEETLLHNSKLVASVSKYTAQRTSEYLNYHLPIAIVYNGINTDQISSGIKKKPLQVIYSGSLWEKKGVFQLAKAWNIVNEKLPLAVLEMYGKGKKDAVRQFLNKKAANTVSFKGHVTRSELFKQLASSAIAVYPSYAECFSLAPMEAMACKTAVIFTSRSSGPELITDNVDGILIDPENVEEIAKKIIYLLNNPDLCAEMAEKAYQKVREKFDIQVIVNNNINLYQSLLSS